MTKGLHDELSLRPAAYFLESPLIELPLYLGLGIIAGLVAVMFKFFSRKVDGGIGRCIGDKSQNMDFDVVDSSLDVILRDSSIALRTVRT